MFSGFPIAMLICSPVAVSGMKRFGRPLVLMVGLIIQGIGSVMFGFADQMTGGPGVNTSAALVVYSLSRFACGAGGACANNAIFSIAADRFPDTLGRVMSLNEVVIGVGFSLGPPIGSVLYLSGGFGLPFIVAGFAVLVFTPFAAMLWQPAPQIVPEYNFQGQEYGMMEVLKLKLVVPAISLLLGTAVFGIVNSTMSLYLQYEVGVPVQAIGAIFAALSAAYALGGAIMGGPVMDCFGALRVCTAGGFFFRLSFGGAAWSRSSLSACGYHAPHSIRGGCTIGVGWSTGSHHHPEFACNERGSRYKRAECYGMYRGVVQCVFTTWARCRTYCGYILGRSSWV